MSVSDITVAALTATPGIGYIGLTWTYSDPRSGALVNVALDMVEVWASTTNDRTTAAKVAEGITSARHSGVANGVTWYYWIKARDNIGGYGVFHPPSTTAGVSGTEATATQVTLSALTAVSNVSQISLQWVVTDPSSNGLGYLGLAAVEVWAASANDRAGAAKVTEGLTSAVHDAVPEGETRYYWVKPRNRNGTYGSFFPSGTTSGVTATARDQAGLVYGVANGKLVVAVSSNAMTAAIKTAAGNDPSASDPVFVAFPDATLTVGAYQVRSITAALSVTVSNGSRMGTDNSTAFRVWFPLFDDAGTLRLGASVRTDSSGALYGLSSGGRASSTAEGGAGAADTVGVIYTGTAVTDKQYFLIGYADWNSGLATAGVWSASPDAVRLAGSGIDRPGQALFEVAGHPPYTPSITYTNLIPWDDTPPRSNEGGALYGPLSVTAQAPMNAIEVECVFTFTHSVASEFILSLIKNISGVTDCIGSAVEYVAAADKPVQVHLKFRTIAGGTSLTFNIQGGAVVAGTTTVGGVSGARKLGGTMNHYFKYQEFAA